MKRNGVFVTGTDTGIGKTFVSVLLMRHFIAQGERVIGMKPIASGASFIDGQLRNEDAISLLQTSNVSVDYELVNPYCFAPAIAPHIAAQQASITISLNHVADCYKQLVTQADRVIVEGVGGWQVPIDEQYDLADLVLQLQLPVIMVVGVRLGCINHALLTAHAIAAQGCRLIGWVANQIDPDMPAFHENISTLETRLNVPLLAVLPHSCHRTESVLTDLQKQFSQIKF